MKKPTHRSNIKDLVEREKSAQKVIREYFDEKRGCVVKVLAGVKEQPFTTIPTGWSD